MKGVVVVATLLAGCYRPSLEDVCSITCVSTGHCPGNAMCVNGQCRPSDGVCPPPGGGDASGDATVPDAFVSPDAAIDAPGTMMCTPAVPMNHTYFGAGTHFSMDRSRHRASMLTYDTTSMVMVISVKESASSDVDANATGFVERILPSTVYSNFESPKMAPDGNSIFFHAENTDHDSLVMVTNRISAGTWSQPVPLTFQDTNGSPFQWSIPAYPGTPTEQSPRRMPVSTSTSAFDEFEEVSATTWRRRAVTSSTDLGVTFLNAPSFTADGRRVVFIGSSIAQSPLAVWIATRASNASSWAPALPLYNAGSGISEIAPFFDTDCAKLWFSDGGSSSTYHAP